MVNPTPVSVAPSAVSAVIAFSAFASVWPLFCGVIDGVADDHPAPAVTGVPGGSVQTTTSGPALERYVPVAVNPPAAAVSAVTVVPLPVPVAGSGSWTAAHVAPASADTSANGLLAPDAVNSVPAATRLSPFAATYSSPARAAPAGSGRLTCRHDRPSADSQAAALVPAEPTAMKPLAVAVTAFISWPRCPGPVPAAPLIAAPRQPDRPGAYQAAATAAPLRAADVW